MLESLRKEFPRLKDFQVDELNNDICEHLTLYVNDPDVLVAALVQNPFGPTKNLDQLRESFDQGVIDSLSILNLLNSLDESLIDRISEIKPVVLLYLTNYFFYFKEKDNYPAIEKRLEKKRIKYAMKLLELMDVSVIRSELEDRFFSRLEPEIFRHYYELLKFTKQQYLEKESEIKEKLQSLLKAANLNFSIKSRVKSIFSIHRKIVKKRILYSQVLDTVGLRIIVDDEKACYTLMSIILKNWAIMSNKVKDYIAVPKANGYKSIHLTILEKEQPVEIQIRTKEMEEYAQYGLAAHHHYKISI